MKTLKSSQKQTKVRQTIITAGISTEIMEARRQKNGNMKVGRKQPLSFPYTEVKGKERYFMTKQK